MQRGQEELASSRHDQNQSKVIAGKSSSYQANAEFQGTSWKLIYDNRALYKEDLDQRTAKNRTLQRLSRLLVAEKAENDRRQEKRETETGGCGLFASWGEDQRGLVRGASFGSELVLLLL